MKMGFFKTFLGTCRGPEAFVHLRRLPAWKVVLYSLLVTILSCIGIAVGRYYALKNSWTYPETRFIENFGNGIHIGKAGILPSARAEQSRRQELPYEGLLIYVSPAGPERSYADETLEKRNYIIIWKPSVIAFACRMKENGNWGVYQTRGKTVEHRENLSYTEMRKEFDSVAASNEPGEWQIGQDEFVPVSSLFKFMRAFLSVLNGAAYFRYTLLILFFGTIVYMVIFYLLEVFPGSERFVIPGEMWKIALCASWPVLVVMNIFPALQLPFESWYEKILLIAWIIYINFIKRYLERNREVLEKMEQ